LLTQAVRDLLYDLNVKQTGGATPSWIYNADPSRASSRTLNGPPGLEWDERSRRLVQRPAIALDLTQGGAAAPAPPQYLDRARTRGGKVDWFAQPWVRVSYAGTAIGSVSQGTIGSYTVDLLNEPGLPARVYVRATGQTAVGQARVPAKLANLVGLESAFTDAFCVVGAATLISLLTPTAAAALEPVPALVRSLGIGLAAGAVGGGLWLLALHVLHESEYASPITFAALLILYVIIGETGGSAALGILTFAVIVGNAGWIGKRVGFSGDVDLGEDVRGFSRQLAFIIKSFFFTFMGAMLAPPWSLIALGVVLGLVLLAVRVPAVWLATRAGEFSGTERRLVTVCLPRGMAAGVLATLPASAGVANTEWLPVTVFSAVVTTILLFAGGFPMTLRRLRAETSEQPLPAPAPASAIDEPQRTDSQ